MEISPRRNVMRTKGIKVGIFEKLVGYFKFLTRRRVENMQITEDNFY